MSETNKKTICVVTEELLDLGKIYDMVKDPSCGAVSTFSGTTRNNFFGKKVTKEYEAYKPMAEKELRKICDQIRAKWDVWHIAIYHKTGLVPIGDPSVIIAISSDHRDDGLEAVHWAIDELKATVPVWKQEFYEDGSVWKGNAECRHTHKRALAHKDVQHGGAHPDDHGHLYQPGEHHHEHKEKQDHVHGPDCKHGHDHTQQQEKQEHVHGSDSKH
jgi:molybdopterin synthase catalytic subunit